MRVIVGEYVGHKLGNVGTTMLANTLGRKWINNCATWISCGLLRLKRKKKKIALFSEIGRVKFFLSLTLPHSRMRIRIYVFNYNIKTSKKTAAATKTKTNNEIKSKTKDEKRISVENLTGYDDSGW